MNDEYENDINGITNYDAPRRLEEPGVLPSIGNDKRETPNEPEEFGDEDSCNDDGAAMQSL